MGALLRAGALLLLAVGANGSPAFSWANCDGDDATAVLDELSLSPSPVVLGSPITLSAAFSVLQPVHAASLKVSVKLYHVVGPLLTPLPCFPLPETGGLHAGSCEYKNICAPGFAGGALCGQWFQKHMGQSCLCPVVPEGNNTIVPQTLSTPQAPSWLPAGQYQATVTLVDQKTNTKLGCVTLALWLAAGGHHHGGHAISAEGQEHEAEARRGE